MRPVQRKVRASKKLRIYKRKTEEKIKELYATYHPIDSKIANLLEQSISFSLLEYNSVPYSNGHKKAQIRLNEIQKEIEELTVKSEEYASTRFY